MKKLSLLFFVPVLSYAGFSKPELIARMSDVNAWNVPDNMWCFTGEPVVEKDQIYLSCLDFEGGVMARWDNKQFSIVARPQNDNYFTGLASSFGKFSWYEADEYSIKRFFQSTDTVTSRELKLFSESNDSFYPVSADSFFFKIKGEAPQLYIWKEDVVTPFFDPKASYIFSPQVGVNGEIAFKTRYNDLDESSPDKIWHYFNGQWRVVLEDRDSNPESPWKSIRNQVNVEGNKVLAIANDKEGDALLLITEGKVEIIARAGKEVKKFDFFSPKMRAGTIIVRGENFSGNKVTFVKDEGPFRSLISQGDIVHTDVGEGRVHYQNQDSIFYGAGGIDENGSVVLQATLTDADQPRTLLGIGLIKFNKE
jgi:hypothetical protein